MTRSTTVQQVVDTNTSAGISTAAARGATKKRSMKRGESATSPRRIKALTERHLRALEYRKMGYTYAQIAAALGYSSAQGAHKAVTSVLKRIVGQRDEHVLLLELERVDALFARPFKDALAGDLMALSACLAIMAHKARLLGLDVSAVANAARTRC